MAWVVQFNPEAQGDALAECVRQAGTALRRRTGRVLLLIGTRDRHTFEVADVNGQPEDIDEELQQILLRCRGVERVERNGVAHGVAA